MYHGVDFSGAATPAEDIWLASADPTTEGLRIDACRSAADAFDAAGRTAVLGALRDWLGATNGPVGLDVSFGLPRPLVPVDDWPAFLDWFADTFADADARDMQAALKRRARASDADGVELKRTTDRPTGASSPYSFITRYQTLHGIRDVLAPLVGAGHVGVEPMCPAEASPLCEIYPAATLRALGLPDERYKGGSHEGERARRREILGGLQEWGVDIPDDLARTVVAEGGGDALDAVVGVVAVARAANTDFAVDADRYDPLEGYIYV